MTADRWKVDRIKIALITYSQNNNKWIDSSSVRRHVLPGHGPRRRHRHLHHRQEIGVRQVCSESCPSSGKKEQVREFCGCFAPDSQVDIWAKISCESESPRKLPHLSFFTSLDNLIKQLLDRVIFVEDALRRQRHSRPRRPPLTPRCWVRTASEIPPTTAAWITTTGCTHRLLGHWHGM